MLLTKAFVLVGMTVFGIDCLPAESRYGFLVYMLSRVRSDFGLPDSESGLPDSDFGLPDSDSSVSACNVEGSPRTDPQRTGSQACNVVRTPFRPPALVLISVSYRFPLTPHSASTIDAARAVRRHLSGRDRNPYRCADIAVVLRLRSERVADQMAIFHPRNCRYR